MKTKLTKETLTFEESVRLAEEMFRAGAESAANQLNLPAPEIIRSDLPDGKIRLVARWYDGAETNECIIQPIGESKTRRN